MDFGLGLARLEDFLHILSLCKIARGLCQKLKTSQKIDGDLAKKLTDLSQKFQLQRIFPFIGEISQFHEEFEKVASEILAVKKNFVDKRNRLTKLIVEEIRVREIGIIVNENVSFECNIYYSNIFD